MMNYDCNNLREMMLKQVNETGFAVVDSNLYLDTHPCDAAAINYHNQMAEAYRRALADYEAQFGPLRASDSRDNQYWTWAMVHGHGKEDADKCGYMKKDWNFLLILKNPMHRWHSS